MASLRLVGTLAASLLALVPIGAPPSFASRPPGPAGQQPPGRSSLLPLQPELFAATGSLVNAVADVDRDGDPDLFVGFNGTPNKLYRNDRGTFVEVGTAWGVADARPTRSGAFGDWDGDGDPDLLVGFAPGAGPVLKLYRNDGGHFTDATAVAGLAVETGAVRQPAWVDLDADGDLDLFVAFRDRANMLFRNETGRLTDVAAELGLADTRRSVGASWADLDADGDLDLIVGNMDGDANGIFRNDGGHFIDVAAQWGLAWGGRTPRDPANGTVRPCVADMDGDGRWDVLFANYGLPGYFVQDQPGRWTNVGAVRGLAEEGHADACAPADFDHDGQLDFYLNGTVAQGRNWPDHLFRNAGNRFDDLIPPSLSAMTADHGALWADLNGDGTLDLALTGQGPNAVLLNLLPDSLARRSVQVRVLDRQGHATRAGAEVRFYAAGTKWLLGTRLVDSGSGYDAQSELPVHFAPAGPGRVDIEVTWPAAGKRITVKKKRVRLDGRHVIEMRL